MYVKDFAGYNVDEKEGQVNIPDAGHPHVPHCVKDWGQNRLDPKRVHPVHLYF